MSVLAAILFLSGMIVLLVGAGRAALALRSLMRNHGTLPSLGTALPPAAWLGLSVYGLVLASAGMLLAR